jgi:hypothetical protein
MSVFFFIHHLEPLGKTKETEGQKDEETGKHYATAAPTNANNRGLSQRVPNTRRFLEDPRRPQ